MSLVGKIWFGPSALKNKFVNQLQNYRESQGFPFPSSKAEAIIVTTNLPCDPSQKMFTLTSGPSDDFPITDFGRGVTNDI